VTAFIPSRPYLKVVDVVENSSTELVIFWPPSVKALLVKPAFADA